MLVGTVNPPAVVVPTDRGRLDGSDEPDPGLPDSALNPFFLAAVEATEYAVYDALFAATGMDGRDGSRLEEFPRERAIAQLQKRLAL
jgi:D-aminopeptidase